MPAPGLTAWIYGSLLLGLRIGPLFIFAPPFSLLRLPTLFRPMIGLAMASAIAASGTAGAQLPDTSLSFIIPAAFRELLLGLFLVLVFQLVFAALYFAGRTIDIQAGYGLALLIDPGSRAQVPLAGMLFAYTAAMVFFSLDGHLDLLRIIGASLHAVPLGEWTMFSSLDRLIWFISIIFLTGFGVAGAAVGALFTVDLTIALLARTVPQMNALLLGFQVKTIVFLLVLPVSFGIGGALLARMLNLTLETLPGLI